MKKLWIALLALVIAIPLALWWFSPKRVLKGRADHLMDVLTLSGEAGSPLRQAKVYSLNGLLAPEIAVTAPGIPDAEGTFEKTVAESAFSWICRYAKTSEFEITEFEEVSINGAEGLTVCLVEAKMEMPRFSPADGTYRVSISWKEFEDGWRFTNVIWEDL